MTDRLDSFAASSPEGPLQSKRRVQIALVVFVVGVIIVIIIAAMLSTDNLRRKGTRDALTRVLASNASAVCNDGSPSAYFIRKRPDSTFWLVVLEGGGQCVDEHTCGYRKRCQVIKQTSYLDFDSIEGHGIMSADSAVNPLFHDANVAYLRYCSSDLWLGRRKASAETWDMNFFGHYILRGYINDLLSRERMSEATDILLVGEVSSGGLGLIYNIDYLNKILAKGAPLARVRGLVDAGYMTIPIEDYDDTAHQFSLMFPIGVKLWDAWMDLELCGRAGLSVQQDWRCLISAELAPYVQTPMFFVQGFYDVVQLEMSGVYEPIYADEEIDFINEYIGKPIQKGLSKLPLVWGGACYGHGFLTDRYAWNHATVRGTSINDVLTMWYSDDHKGPIQFVDTCIHYGCNPGCPFPNYHYPDEMNPDKLASVLTEECPPTRVHQR
jgi:hypothetical protein